MRYKLFILGMVACFFFIFVAAVGIVVSEASSVVYGVTLVIVLAIAITMLILWKKRRRK